VRITDIRTMLLSGPDPHGVGGGFRTWTMLLVRVDTDEGIYGLGEAGDMLGTREAIGWIRRRLIGRDPLAVRPIVSELLYGGMPPHDEEMSITATPTGPIVWGASGVEMALCDLAGKALGTPVYNLLGGAFRDRVRIYLDRSSPADPTDLDAWAALGADAVAAGFVDLKLDAEQAAPEHTADRFARSLAPGHVIAIGERVAAVRAAIGDAIDLSVDCHMHYDVVSAIRLAHELAPLRLKWLEDPTPITNPDALADVRARSPVPICIGEMLIAEQLRQFVDRRACDILHPDVLFVGGLHEARRVADYAELHYMPVALHGNSGALGTIAAAHVGAASRTVIGLEYHFHDAPWIGAVVERDVALFRDGHLVLTDAPGLGVTLNEDVCGARLAEGERLFARGGSSGYPA
jgi:L-alanine-DL-glutamate epimerase-like enolase superfamily enzyme